MFENEHVYASIYVSCDHHFISMLDFKNHNWFGDYELTHLDVSPVLYTVELCSYLYDFTMYFLIKTTQTV